ncbi:hypothetical protein ACCC88_00740 [Sphingomonas sp. Sphisp140]|uniref:hypothetical protein n=1 Tax=unclassified Sphingomonas TaxID=196159 RepID=UPI0039B0D076
MAPAEAFEALAAALQGLPIGHIWRGYGSALFLELGTVSEVPRGTRDGETWLLGQVTLGIEWSWRIEDATAIRCGSWSDEALWEPVFAQLRGARIAQCALFGALPEVALTTDTGMRLLSFSTTDGQPRWQLVDRRKEGADRWFSVRDGKLHLGDGSELPD